MAKSFPFLHLNSKLGQGFCSINAAEKTFFPAKQLANVIQEKRENILQTGFKTAHH